MAVYETQKKKLLQIILSHLDGEAVKLSVCLILPGSCLFMTLKKGAWKIAMNVAYKLLGI